MRDKEARAKARNRKLMQQKIRKGKLPLPPTEAEIAARLWKRGMDAERGEK